MSSGLPTVSVVRMNSTNLTNDLRVHYKNKILSFALEKTVATHGPYEIYNIDILTTAARATFEVQSGKNINLFIGITTVEREEAMLPIRIPIRRGILNYRVLAINKNNLNKFSTITNVIELKKLAAGMRLGWATTDIFKKQSFNFYELVTLDGLYNMLNRDVIDYIPRGINEIYDEIDARQPNNLIVEPKLVVFLPAPTYIFVSPNETHLAKRIEAGLEKMVSDGTLKAIFYEFYSDDIKKADIDSRRVIAITNPELPISIPFDRPELWFTNDVKE
jgi:ABC-type amino acid transport substrate-binding protein